jgi:hypothetical protein
MASSDSSVCAGSFDLEALLVMVERVDGSVVAECSITRCALLKFRRESSYGMRKRGWSCAASQPRLRVE